MDMDYVETQLIALEGIFFVHSTLFRKIPYISYEMNTLFFLVTILLEKQHVVCLTSTSVVAGLILVLLELM